MLFTRPANHRSSKSSADSKIHLLAGVLQSRDVRNDFNIL